MTLKDLIENCYLLTALEVEIRDNGKFVHRYRFGRSVCLYPSEADAYQQKHFPTDIDTTPINYHDDNPSGGWGVKTRVIPKQLLDMTVDYWRPATVFRRRDPNEVKLVVTLDQEGQDLQKPKKPGKAAKKAARAAGATDMSIDDGTQMSIDDWLRNEEE